jgi:hypothetical protein
MTRPTPPDVVGAAELGELTGAAPSTVRSWIVRGTTPPLPPHTQLAAGPVWKRPAILAWLEDRRSPVNAAAHRLKD